MEKQITFGMLSDELAQAKTNKKEFLKKMDAIIPWNEFIGIIKPYYYKGEYGNKPYDIELMLRIYIIQNCYDLSDMGVMDEILDSRAFSEFCGVSSPDEVPNGDTIGRFRNILVKNHVQEELFIQVAKIMRKRNLILKKGTIVDSTIIESPSSTKNKNKERDPDAHSVKKGNQWHFGYKAHIGADSDTGIVHHLKVTAANKHDVEQVNDLVYGTEEKFFGDSGYLNAEEHFEEGKFENGTENVDFEINQRRGKKKKLDPNDRLAFEIKEYNKSAVRSKVEHVFAVVKRLFKFRRTRYRGLEKQTAKFNIMFALANLYLADRKFLTA